MADHNHIRRAVVGVAAALTAAALAGCGASAPPPPPVTVTVTAEPATPTPTPTETITSAPEPPPAPAPAPVPNAAAPEVVEGPAHDNGARPGANAAPAIDGGGAPIGYTVMSGDSFFDIAQRFDLPQQQLLRMNPGIPNFGETLYIGQVINLDWTKAG